MSLSFFVPHGRLGRLLCVTVTLIFLAGLAVLSGCGGGDDSPQPRIEVIAGTPDSYYPKARLLFDSDQVTGFLGDAKGADRVCWDSNGIVEAHGYMGCGQIQRGVDGKLFVDVPLFYVIDEGTFVAYVGDQASFGMNVEMWQLPPKWQALIGFRGRPYLHLDVL